MRYLFSLLQYFIEGIACARLKPAGFVPASSLQLALFPGALPRKIPACGMERPK